MATLLYRIGRGAYRHRRIVLAGWLAVLAAVVCCLTAFGGKLDNTFTIPGSQSQRALDTMAEHFPAAAGTSAQLVFSAPKEARVTEPKYAAAISRTLAAAQHAPQVAVVISPQLAGTVTPDQRIAMAQVDYRVDRADLDKDALDALRRTTGPAEAAGLTVAVGGQAYGNGVVTPGALELIGVAVALAVLAVTFGSLLAAGMPLLSAFAGIAIGLLGLLALSSGVTVSSTALSLALMLGLAVGIDYALFILSRHRGELAVGTSPEESAALAVGTAGNAVLFAGTTVIIALAGLCVVRIPFLTVMGLSAAATVLIAVLVAVTLLPALFGFAGSRLAARAGSRSARRALLTRGSGEGDCGESSAAGTCGERWARIVTAKPLLTVVAVVAALVVAALPAADLRLALPDNGTAAKGTSQRDAYDTIATAFGPGFNGPLLILVQTGARGDAGQPAAAAVAVDLREMPGVAVVGPPKFDPRSGDAVIQLIAKSGPQDQATRDLVTRIRDREPAIREATAAAVSVTGNTAVGIDVSDRLSSSLVPFAVVVVGLCLVLLLVVFRSLVVPVKATVGFLLSVGASLGAVVAVFQWGWFDGVLGVARTGPVVSFLPIVLMAVLFGLAMDYEVFLVSSMLAQWSRTRMARPSVIRGARQASRVVTAAALIMFCVFASFVTTDDTIVKPIAFSMAFGVLVDAFLIRMTLVPAVLAAAGRGAWWLPRWLERLLPDLDLEGVRLHSHAAKDPGEIVESVLDI